MHMFCLLKNVSLRETFLLSTQAIRVSLSETFVISAQSICVSLRKIFFYKSTQHINFVGNIENNHLRIHLNTI